MTFCAESAAACSCTTNPIIRRSFPDLQLQGFIQLARAKRVSFRDILCDMITLSRHSHRWLWLKNSFSPTPYESLFVHKMSPNNARGAELQPGTGRTLQSRTASVLSIPSPAPPGAPPLSLSQLPALVSHCPTTWKQSVAVCLDRFCALDCRAPANLNYPVPASTASHSRPTAPRPPSGVSTHADLFVDWTGSVTKF